MYVMFVNSWITKCSILAYKIPRSKIAFLKKEYNYASMICNEKYIIHGILYVSMEFAYPDYSVDCQVSGLHTINSNNLAKRISYSDNIRYLSDMINENMTFKISMVTYWHERKQSIAFYFLLFLHFCVSTKHVLRQKETYNTRNRSAQSNLH